MEPGLRDHYQWATLGDSIGSLLSACAMAQSGASVLILPLSPSRGTLISKAGQILDLEPNAILGLGGSSASWGSIRQLLETIPGASLLLEKVIPTSLIEPQVVTGTSRIRLASHPLDFRREWVREVGARGADHWKWSPDPEVSVQLVLSYWREFLARGVSVESKQAMRNQRKGYQSIREVEGTLRGAKPPFRDESSYQEWLAGAVYALTGHQCPVPSSQRFQHLLALGQTVAGYRGGAQGFRDALLSLAKSLGASVPQGVDCRRIFVDSGRFTGVQVTQQGKMITMDAAVLGCSLTHAKDYLYFSGKGRKDQLVRPSRPCGWRYTVAVTVHKEAIPPGVGGSFVWSQEGAPPLEVTIASPKDYGTGHADQRIVYLRTVLPHQSETLQAPYQREIGLRMFRQAKELLPFLDFHVVKIFPDFRDEKSKEGDGLDEAYHFVDLDFIPDFLRVYDGSGMGYLSGVEDLYLASNESYPEMGTFGSVIASLESMLRHALTTKNQGNELPTRGVDAQARIE